MRDGLERRAGFCARGKSMPVRRDLYESKSRLIVEDNQGVSPFSMEDVERLDETIGRYFSIALSAEQDFDLALRASNVIMELMEMKWKLLESFIRWRP
jgi:hypothetical protein